MNKLSAIGVFMCEKNLAKPCLVKDLYYICTRNTERKSSTGEMAEWSNAAVLKTVDCNRSGGSNPSFSAVYLDYKVITSITPNFTPKNVKLGFFMSFILDTLALEYTKS